MKIPYVNIAAQWDLEKNVLLPIIEKVMASGQYIGGQYVEGFEADAARLCKTKHCVALNSGTDALVYGLLALGVKPGDEVITPPNSFIASTAAIVNIGARPVFVDVLPDQNIDPEKIEAAISPRTKAIMPVHLSGRMARMDQIKAIADRHKIPIIEDGAQAIGSVYQDIPSGKWGKVGCFSTHPLKNLNACGDGGFLVTDDDGIASQVRLLRNHGLVDRNTVTCFGYNSRMDALQAAILTYRIENLREVTTRRQKNAAIYRDLLNPVNAYIPAEMPGELNTYHTFVIQVNRRDYLRDNLQQVGIETAIHYPIPIHLQPAAKPLGYTSGDFPETELQAGRILTLPIHQYLTSDEVAEIAKQVNRICENG